MKSFMANPDTVERKWYVVDAEGATLGRLASQVASVLRGKNKPIFTLTAAIMLLLSTLTRSKLLARSWIRRSTDITLCMSAA